MLNSTVSDKLEKSRYHDNRFINHVFVHSDLGLVFIVQIDPYKPIHWALQEKHIYPLPLERTTEMQVK